MNIFLPKDVYAGVISDAPTLAELLTSALLSILTFCGVLAVLGIVLSGIWYMTSGGDAGRVEIAKKALTACIIGLVVILTSWILVQVLSRVFGSS